MIAQRLGQPVDYLVGGNQDDDAVLQAATMLESAGRDLTAGTESDLVLAERKLHQALKLAARLERDDLLASGHRLLMTCLRRQKKYEALLEVCDRAVETLKVRGDRKGLAETYAEMAHAAYLLEEYPNARRAYEKAVLFSSTLKSMQEFRVSALRYLASCLLHLGDRQGAIARYEEAYREGVSLNAPVLIASVSMGLGWALFRSGDLEGAIDWTRRSLAQYKRAESRNEVLAQHNLAVIQMARGHWEEGFLLLQSCFQTYGSYGRRLKQASVLEELARYWVHKGDLDSAEECCWQALDLLNMEDDGILRGRIFRFLGKLYASRQRWDLAHNYLHLSAELLRRLKAADELSISLGELSALPFHRPQLAQQTGD